MTRFNEINFCKRVTDKDGHRWLWSSIDLYFFNLIILGGVNWGILPQGQVSLTASKWSTYRARRGFSNQFLSYFALRIIFRNRFFLSPADATILVVLITHGTIWNGLGGPYKSVRVLAFGGRKKGPRENSASVVNLYINSFEINWRNLSYLAVTCDRS